MCLSVAELCGIRGVALLSPLCQGWVTGHGAAHYVWYQVLPVSSGTTGIFVVGRGANVLRIGKRLLLGRGGGLGGLAGRQSRLLRLEPLPKVLCLAAADL